MQTSNRQFAMAQLVGSLHLALVALRRLLRSRQTLVSVVLFSFAVLVVVAWSMRRERSPNDFIEHVVLAIYVPFLLPMFCLCYASASIAGDREEGTVVYLLSTPISRPLIHLSKYAASLLLVLIWTLGGLTILCAAAGAAGWQVLPRLWPAVFLTTLAYVGLFHLLSVLFRRATIIALAYALFLEVFIGNMPGTIKRLSVAFYTKCLIFDAAADFGVPPWGPYNPALFLPVAPATASALLCGLAAGLFVCGTWLFTRCEYAVD